MAPLALVVGGNCWKTSTAHGRQGCLAGFCTALLKVVLCRYVITALSPHTAEEHKNCCSELKLPPKAKAEDGFYF